MMGKKRLYNVFYHHEIIFVSMLLFLLWNMDICIHAVIMSQSESVISSYLAFHYPADLRPLNYTEKLRMLHACNCGGAGKKVTQGT